MEFANDMSLLVCDHMGSHGEASVIRPEGLSTWKMIALLAIMALLFTAMIVQLASIAA
ncbi:MAG: hypothetical protein SOU51_02695 [Collinsella sp.]|nr:hypothetical protein [Collinsella sp.]